LNILVSDYHWRNDIGSQTVDPNRYVDLANSVFMKPSKDGQTIEAARKSISAIHQSLGIAHQRHDGEGPDQVSVIDLGGAVRVWGMFKRRRGCRLKSQRLG